ncbi:uncharacterized protein LOC127721833 [Mytilus californianus]|uniref:uncharacterized protein LOC127721833 n=1 Tax=Mytilus californianus TaxID=6549 RepID=UPI0022465637|nr:uncharacterized protein LOC127721833 [Mytilus californianus]
MDEIATIDKAVASVCKGHDKRSDDMMMMAPDSNWDQFLTPAPCAIALLGDLILFSADMDFSLDEKPPMDGFKLLRYPNSFRESLVQVSNAGLSAFNEAHTSMDQIRLHSGNIDGQIKNAVKFLMQGTPEEVKRMLPMSLSKIQNIADESLLLAKAIEDRFVGVMELTVELLETSTNTKGVYDEKTRETEIAIEVARTEREQSRMKEIKYTEKKLSNMEKEVKEAQSDFEEAINNIPSVGDLIGIAVCEAVIEGVRNITSNPSKISERIKKKLGTSAANDEDSEKDDTYFDNELSRQRVYSEVSTITRYIYQLVEITTGRTDDNGQQCPDMGRIGHGDLGRIQQFIETARNHVISEVNSGELRERVLKLCDDAVDICNTLQHLANSMADLENRNAVISEAVNKSKYLQNESQKLEVEAHKALGRNPLNNKSPHLSKMPTQSSSAVTAATENARYKTELAKEKLRAATRRQEKAADELRESNDKLTKVLKDMAKLELKEIDFDSIRETLVKGIKALAEVREQWGKLVRFFQMLSNLIKCCLHSSLTNSVDQATMGRELQMTNNAAPLSDTFRDVIFEQTSKASQVAYIVRTIAGTYVQISNEHLMDIISCLGLLVALDPKKDEHEIRRKHEELHNGCQEAQKAILSIVMKQKEEFNAKVEEKIAKLHEIEKIMPPIESERIKEIQTNETSGNMSAVQARIHEKYKYKFEKVLEFLLKGLEHLSAFIQHLNEITGGRCQDDDKYIAKVLFPLIEKAKTEFDEMATYAKSLLQQINSDFEQCVADLKVDNVKLKKIDSDLTDLEKELQGTKKAIDTANEQCRRKREDLSAAENALSDARRKLEDAKTATVAAGVSTTVVSAFFTIFVPPLGLAGMAAGLGTGIVGITALEEAVTLCSNSFISARSEVQSSESALERASNAKTVVEHKLNGVNKNTQQIKTHLEELKTDKNRLEEYRKLTITFAEDYKKFHRQLCDFYGKYKILTCETAGGYSLQILQLPTKMIGVSLSSLCQCAAIKALYEKPMQAIMRKHLLQIEYVKWQTSDDCSEIDYLI